MSADVSVQNLKFWGAEFGRNTLFGPKVGGWPTSRRAGVTMPAVVDPVPATVQSTATAVAEAPPAVASPLVEHSGAFALPATELSSADQDRLLVRASLGGNQAAFTELVLRYQSAVYNMAYRMLGDPSEAEDAAQEVFVRAWNQLKTFQLERRFSTWLLSIASHHCIDMLRRRKPQAPLDGVALYIESSDPEPDQIVLQSEQRDMVRALLDTLPEKYRSVTVLRYFGDMSYEEISRHTGLTESAVKTQLHRARRMLAERLLEREAAQNRGNDNG